MNLLGTSSLLHSNLLPTSYGLFETSYGLFQTSWELFQTFWELFTIISSVVSLIIKMIMYFEYISLVKSPLPKLGNAYTIRKALRKCLRNLLYSF